MLTFLRILSVWILLSSVAQAHLLPGIPLDLETGLLHPVRGLDHLLAMTAVGLWFGSHSSRWAWAGSLLLISSVTIGALLAVFPLQGAWIEPGISTSLIFLGILLAGRFSVTSGWVLTVLTGLIHGYAHGHEMPPTLAASSYALGFLITTIGLLRVGIWLGHRLKVLPRALLGLGFCLSIEGAYLLISGQMA